MRQCPKTHINHSFAGIPIFIWIEFLVKFQLLVNDLYLVSDLMITDYSSTMFDYANLMRPMVFHMYDADSYKQDVRGL